MQIKYDTVADAVYMRVNEGAVDKTVRLDDRLIVDRDAAGNILGIEILDASSQQALVASLEQSVQNGVPVSITDLAPIVV